MKDFYRFFITLILTFYLFNCINRFVTMMADVAQLVRALVCGTRCREFESLHPPHIEKSSSQDGLFLLPFYEKFLATIKKATYKAAGNS